MMNNKHKKKAKVAMTIALTATSIAHSTSNILAQGESTIEEHLPIDDTEEKVEAVGDVEINKRLFSDPEPNPGPDPEPFPNPAPAPDPNPDFGDWSISIDEINFPDAVFREYIKNNFDTDGNGVLSRDESNNITSIDVSHNQNITSIVGIEHFFNLTHLNCGGTGITSLDVSKNTALIELNCGGTRITNLDVSKNIALTDLYCSFSRIISLDVTNNIALERLECSATDITSLDVSKNIALVSLDVYSNSLAWLHIGDNSSLNSPWLEDLRAIHLGEIYNTFNIREIFPGIDPNRIQSINGASLDKTTGIVSGYTDGTPITYTYDCGTADNGTVILDVTLEFTKQKEQSTIIIHDNLNKVYDGKAVVDPTNVEKIGSTEAVTFEWYTADDKKLDEAPVNAGSYKVKAILPEDANYEGVEVEKEFTIAKAISTIVIRDNLNKAYDGQVVEDPIDIEKIGSTGTVSFEWYMSDDTLLQGSPKEVGSYKVKAILAGDANHDGAEVEKEFTITKATSTILIHDDLNKVYDGIAVVDPTNIEKTGSTGNVSFEWYMSDGTLLQGSPKEVGSYKVKAILAGDTNYDRVEVEKAFTISKASSTIIIHDDLNKVYDGQAVVEPMSIETTGSTGAITYEWYKKEESTTRVVTWTKLAGSPSEVGNYKVKVILPGDANHDGIEVEKSFTISKAISTVIINNDLNKVYDGTAVVEPSITKTGSTGNVSFEWYTADGTSLQIAPSEVGSYKVKVILPEDANHDGIEVEKAFTISKATSTITINDNLSKEYDGVAVLEPTDIIVTGTTGNASFEWYTADGTLLQGAPSEVGNYKLVVVVGEDINYSGVRAEVEFSIKDTQQITPPIVEDSKEDVETNDKEEVNESIGNGVNGVQTGDVTKVGLWTILVVLSIGVILFFIKKSRKED